jgi:hypothetical protein
MNKENNNLKIRKNESSFIEEFGSKESKVEALYQKIGSKWFTFYLVDDELFMSSVDDQDLKSNNFNKNKKHGHS